MRGANPYGLLRRHRLQCSSQWTTASGRGYYAAMPAKPSNRIASITTVSKLLVDASAHMWDNYRLARRAGYSILRSLELALFYGDIPDDPEADAFDDAVERAEAESEAIGEATRKEVEQPLNRQKASS